MTNPLRIDEMRAVIAKLPPGKRAMVEGCMERLQGLLNEYKGMGVIALALVGAEVARGLDAALQAEDEEETTGMEYTHVDASGMLWRFVGSRPVSKLADEVMRQVKGEMGGEGM